MEIDAISQLYKVVEYTAGEMFARVPAPAAYSRLSLLVFASMVISLLPTTNGPYYLVAVLAGAIGSTAMTVYLALLLSALNKHIELSKYHYLNVRDLFKKMGREGELKNYSQHLERLLLVSKLSIEYMPALLIPAYSALIFVDSKPYFVAFMTAFMVMCSATMYEAIARFNDHLSRENVLENEIYSLIGSSGPKKYVEENFGALKILLSIVTYSVFLTYMLARVSEVLTNHVSSHRHNYVELVKYVASQLKR